MTTFVTGTQKHWIGFQLFSELPTETLLVGCLPTFVQSQYDNRQISRFFFLRYSEGGPHLRLRFRTTRQTSSARLGEDLKSLLQRWRDAHFPTGRPPRLLTQAYDRTQLYFGESLLSVYAELMHEQTSWLAIELLSHASGQAALRLLTMFVVRSLLAATLASTAQREWIHQWEQFTTEAATHHDQLIAAWQPVVFDTLLSALNARTTPSAISTNRHLSSWQKLMSRLLHLRGGYEVSVHAVHLLCNKVGLSLSDEFNLSSVLGASLRSNAYAA